MGAFLLGPFIIKYEWILLLLSALTSYFIMKTALKEERSFQQSFLNVVVNASLIGIIAYKFSAILFKPSLLFDYPMSIFYFTGGGKGALLGFFLSFVYFISQFKKYDWPLKECIKAIVYGIVTFFIIFWLLRTLFFLIV